MPLYFALSTVENNKNKKSVKFQGDTLIFCDFIQVFVFTTNHHLNKRSQYLLFYSYVFLSIVFLCMCVCKSGIREKGRETNRIYDGVEAETRKSQASFQII